ncbi:hypothetical protein LTR85_005785 [Meristemomyces frigidus]|nr:hypothetical protein LTR85_005785 [Meristemomyces frigidus]
MAAGQQGQQIKKQLDEEVQHLTNSYQNLRTAQQKFRDCIASVKDGVAESVKGMHDSAQTDVSERYFVHIWCADSLRADKALLVPLTSSLYVPGQLADTEHVLVDVGTGFYVEKTTGDAQKFYNGKIEELGKNIKDLENIVNGKANNLRVVEEVLRQKVLAGQQGGQASAGAS